MKFYPYRKKIGGGGRKSCRPSHGEGEGGGAQKVLRSS